LKSIIVISKGTVNTGIFMITPFSFLKDLSRSLGKNICLTLILTSTTSLWANIVLGSSDTLPPEGRSLFDHIFVKEGGFDGEKALNDQPVEDLVRLLDQFGQVTYTMVPFGRSLQKKSANAAHPRTLFTLDSTEKPGPYLTSGRLFVAYVELANTLEVISYNERANRFEYQVVKDFYPGGKPQTHYVERSVCLGCHQGGAPLFPFYPWHETSAGDLISTDAKDDIIDHVGDDYLGLPLSPYMNTAFQEISVNHSSLHYDDMVKI
jgi:hypothetical protein